MSRGRLIVLTLMATILAGEAGGNDAGDRSLVSKGEGWWTTSPDPMNPVACATCHFQPGETRGWAASFPKLKPQPPPHARVMTLLQANAEAVRRHYRVADPLPMATAITAYLTAHGAGMPLTPGLAVGQPVFPARLRALDQSVSRGRRLYGADCARCHEGFPRARGRGGESLEEFLDRHTTPRGRLPWDSQAMADLVSYLVAARGASAVMEDP